jgi:hypothetical protein
MNVWRPLDFGHLQVKSVVHHSILPLPTLCWLDSATGRHGSGGAAAEYKGFCGREEAGSAARGEEGACYRLADA